jgi:hypothetical protein
MHDRDFDSPAGPRGTGLGWFFLGTAIGFVLSAAAVVTTAELTRRRCLRPAKPGYEQGEVDLIEDITAAVGDGLHMLAQAAHVIGQSFSEARRELIQFGLNPTSTSASSSYAWYAGDEDDLP